MDFTISGSKENGLQCFNIDDWNIVEVNDEDEEYIIEDERREGYEEYIFSFNGNNDSNTIDWVKWIEDNYEYDEETFCIVQVRQRRWGSIIIQDDGTWEPVDEQGDDWGEQGTYVIQNGEVKVCEYSYANA